MTFASLLREAFLQAFDFILASVFNGVYGVCCEGNMSDFI